MSDTPSCYNRYSDDSRDINYGCNIFIIQATGQSNVSGQG